MSFAAFTGKPSNRFTFYYLFLWLPVCTLLLTRCAGKPAPEAETTHIAAGVKDSVFFRTIDSIENNHSYLLALRTLDSAHERLTATAINKFYFHATRAGILARAGYSKQAIPSGNEALEVARELNDTALLAHGELGLGYIFLMNYDSLAKKYIDAAKKLQPSLKNDTALLLRILNNQAVYDMMVAQNYAQSAATSLQELAIARQYHDLNDMASTYNNLTGVYYYTRKPDSALMYIDSTIMLCRQEGNKYKLATAFINKCSFCIDLGKTDMAERYADSAEKLFVLLNESKPEVPLARYLLEKQRKNYAAALAAYEIYDSLNKIVQNNRHVLLTDLADSEQKIATIEKQMQQKDRAHAANIAGYERKRRTILVLGAGLFLLLLMLAYIYKSEVKRRKLAQHNLAQAEALLQERTSLLSQTRQNTINQSYAHEMAAFRQKLSMELHDNVAGALAGMKFKLSMLPPSPLTGEIIANIGNIYDNVRSISHGLISYKPTADFADEIRRLVLGYLQGLPVQVNLDLQNESQLNRLPNDLKEQIQLIVQELLANVVKHSGATRFDAAVTCNNGRVELVFSDNGRGYETEKVQGGIGLRNIHRRLQEMNGDFVVTSGQNHGARTTIHIPVP